MNVLLDTCALLALAGGELPDGAAAALRRAPEAYVSVVSPWEVDLIRCGGHLPKGGYDVHDAERHTETETPPAPPLHGRM